jgi:hypothetical protein
MKDACRRAERLHLRVAPELGLISVMRECRNEIDQVSKELQEKSHGVNEWTRYGRYGRQGPSGTVDF